MEKKKPEIRFNGFEGEWVSYPFRFLFTEKRDTTQDEFEDQLLSCAIDGIYLNSELFNHFRGSTTIGYLKVKRYDLILSAQNLHLGNANVNLRFASGIISPAYKVYTINGDDPYFINAWVKSEHAKNFFMSATTEGASLCRKNIEWEFLYDKKICVPSLSEQEKIGLFLTTLDKLIAKLEAKLDKLRKLKQALLEKMFVNVNGGGYETPEIRFKGYTDKWQVKELRNYFMVATERNQSEEYNKYDIYSVSREFGVINQIEYQGKSFAGASLANYGIVQTGDLVYTKSPLKSQPYGIIKTNEGEAGIVSALYGVYHPKECVHSPFTQVYFDLNSRLNNYLRPLVNKGAKNTLLISDEDSLNGRVAFPSKDEQKVIAHLFKEHSLCERKTELKLTKLRNIKQSLLQKMFA